MEEAERIAKEEHKSDKICVISGMSCNTFTFFVSALALIIGLN